jgi:hypothetical protein
VKIAPLRSDEEKSDLVASWSRGDYEFFSSGACHILAHVFLREYPGLGYRAVLIRPIAPKRGTHVVAASAKWVFDANGLTEREAYLQDYFAQQRARDASWSADIVELVHDPASWEFCREHRHRHPSQFLHDPIPRAVAFLKTFDLPL